MCGRADADGGSCGHQVPVDISKPVEATRPGSVTLPPLMAGPHQRRLDVLTIVATLGGLLFRYDIGVINGALGRMSQDLGLTPYTEGHVTSTLLIGAAIGAVLCGRINDTLAGRLAMATVAHRFDLTWSPGRAAGDFPTSTPVVNVVTGRPRGESGRSPSHATFG